MSVGHPEIDADHRHLIGLINAFEQVRTEDEVEAVLKALIEYTVYHFGREERVQQECQFPFRDSHRKAHGQIIARLDQLYEQWTAPGAARAGLMAAIGSLLREWLIGHIVKEDLRMRPLLRGGAGPKR